MGNKKNSQTGLHRIACKWNQKHEVYPRHTGAVDMHLTFIQMHKKALTHDHFPGVLQMSRFWFGWLFHLSGQPEAVLWLTEATWTSGVLTISAVPAKSLTPLHDIIQAAPSHSLSCALSLFLHTRYLPVSFYIVSVRLPSPHALSVFHSVSFYLVWSSYSSMHSPSSLQVMMLFHLMQKKKGLNHNETGKHSA